MFNLKKNRDANQAPQETGPGPKKPNFFKSLLKRRQPSLDHLHEEDSTDIPAPLPPEPEAEPVAEIPVDLPPPPPPPPPKPCRTVQAVAATAGLCLVLAAGLAFALQAHYRAALDEKISALETVKAEKSSLQLELSNTTRKYNQLEVDSQNKVNQAVTTALQEAQALMTSLQEKQDELDLIELATYKFRPEGGALKATAERLAAERQTNSEKVVAVAPPVSSAEQASWDSVSKKAYLKVKKDLASALDELASAKRAVSAAETEAAKRSAFDKAAGAEQVSGLKSEVGSLKESNRILALRNEQLRKQIKAGVCVSTE